MTLREQVEAAIESKWNGRMRLALGATDPDQSRLGKYVARVVSMPLEPWSSMLHSFGGTYDEVLRKLLRKVENETPAEVR